MLDKAKKLPEKPAYRIKGHFKKWDKLLANIKQ